MRTMYELCDGKVWRAVDAMITGLRTHSGREDFKINMMWWASTDGVLCFGCAATCAVQQLTGINVTKDNVFTVYNHAEWGDDSRDWRKFASAINCLRQGMLGVIFDYFKKDRRLIGFRNLPVLHTHNWQTELKHYTTLLIALKEFDI